MIIGFLDSLPWGNPLFTVSIVLAAVFAAYRLYKPRSTLPVPACSIPVFGATFTYLRYVKERRFFKFVLEQQRVLGPLYNLNIFGLHAPIVADAREARRMVTDTDAFYRCEDLQNSSTDIANYALFMLPSGALWKHHRKLIQPAFAPSNIRKVFPVSIEKADKLVAIMRETIARDPSATVNLYDCFQRVTLDIIGDIALGGHQFDCLDALRSVYPVDVGAGAKDDGMFEGFEHVISAVGNRFGLPEYLWGLLGASRKSIARDAGAVQELARAMIDKRQRELDEEVKAGVVRDKKDYDVMDRILIPNADRELLSKEEIVDEVIGFVLAGHETSSNTATFLMWHLMENPRTMAVLYDEIVRVCGPHGEPTADMLKEMPYLDAVFKESIRLKSPVPVIQRTAVRETLVCGHVLPANAKIMVNIAAMHRDPNYWGPNADEFVPERWEDKVRMTELETMGAYMPFGGGPMMCVGMKLAIPEVKILVIRLLQNFEHSLRPGQDFSWTVDGLTAGFRQGVYTYLSPRP
ncbi:hypothetical protein HDU86_003780 [Geranomyces michiganensis]|nr:hypothetical protein HDU86_003780 [Geranomyces michiganensis]